jgi:hypothetical protein
VAVTRVGLIHADLGSLLEAAGVVQFLKRGERAAGIWIFIKSFIYKF